MARVTEKILEKTYYVNNTERLNNALVLLHSPIFALCCERTLCEMNTSKLYIICLESQVCGIEAILKDNEVLING